MASTILLDQFLDFGLAVAIGFLIGLERSLSGRSRLDAGVRDFVLFALLGAISAFLWQTLDSYLFLTFGFLGLLTLLLAYYWRSSTRGDADPGITSEIAAVLTFFLGVLAVMDFDTLAIALAVITTLMLSQKERLAAFRDHIEQYELNAALKLLVISFIVLPVLPQESLDRYLTLPLGEVVEIDERRQSVVIALAPGHTCEPMQVLRIYSSEYSRYLGEITVKEATPFRIHGAYEGDFFDRIAQNETVRSEIGIPVLSVMASAITPYRVWWIVVLVSSVGFVGYVLVKILGGRAGVAATGLAGGMASSTATTLSFARRSAEAPQWNQQFAVAILLASTVMFPRLLVQVAVVDQALMQRMAFPILVMAGVGVVLALRHLFTSRGEQAEQQEQLRLDNPFSLKSALTFGLVFAAVLMVTQLAITYLGNAWIPAVALVSGLTDADAIAFSMSSARMAGDLSLDWAAFNAVLGAISNTVMKLFLVAALANRGMLKYLFVDILLLCTAGLTTALLYYEF